MFEESHTICIVRVIEGKEETFSCQHLRRKVLNLKRRIATNVITAVILSFLTPIVGLSPAATAATYGATTSIKTSGGGGGVFTDPCPSGYVLVQVKSTSAPFGGSTQLTQLQGVCQAVTSDGTALTGTTSLTLTYGATGSSPDSDSCSGARPVIKGAVVYKSSGSPSYVTGVKLICGALPFATSTVTNPDIQVIGSLTSDEWAFFAI